MPRKRNMYVCPEFDIDVMNAGMKDCMKATHEIKAWHQYDNFFSIYDICIIS